MDYINMTNLFIRVLTVIKILLKVVSQLTSPERLYLILSVLQDGTRTQVKDMREKSVTVGCKGRLELRQLHAFQVHSKCLMHLRCAWLHQLANDKTLSL